MKMQFAFRLSLLFADLTLTASQLLGETFLNAQNDGVMFVDDLTFESTETARVICAVRCARLSYWDCATFTFTPSSAGSNVGTCRGHGHARLLTQGDQVMMKENSKAFHRVDCRSGWSRFGLSCYQFQPNIIPYIQAKIQCEAMNSYLAEIESVQESLFLSNLTAASSGLTYFGLNDMATEGVYVLASSGRVANFTYWKTGEPNNDWDKEDCVTLPNQSSGNYPKWNDVSCTEASVPSVCEYSLK